MNETASFMIIKIYLMLKINYVFNGSVFDFILVSFKVAIMIAQNILLAANRLKIIKNPPFVGSNTPLIIGADTPPILEKILTKLVPVDLT